MGAAKEIYQLIVRYSEEIRGAMSDTRFKHGEIYADAVFGALLSAIDTAELKKEISDIAFGKYREKAAMCVSLERENIAAEAMNCAVERGIATAITLHLGEAPDEKIITEFLKEVSR